MRYKTSLLAIDSIDSDDDTYLIGEKGDLQPLLESIREAGLINPPVLKKREDQYYRIICGKRRVLCCRELGWSEIPAHIANKELSALDCLKTAISDNRSHRSLNLVEQSRGIEKLRPHFDEKQGFAGICLLLGIPLNRKVFEKIKGLARLDTRIREGIVQGRLSFEGAVALSPFEPQEQSAFFELMSDLNLSQNKECELIALVDEIARRESLSPIQVIRSKPVHDILNAANGNRSEKTRKVRDYLKRRRFPSITEAEDRFSINLRSLNLANSIRLSPPPFFEGTTYTVRLSFNTVEQLKKCLQTLQKAAENPAFQKIVQKS